MPKKAPEWLDDDIREFYPIVNGEIRAIQRAITERRGTEPKYMTITDHMKRLGLERPRDKSKKAPRDTPMSVDEAPIEALPGQMSIDDANTPPPDTDLVSTLVDMAPVNVEISDHLSPGELQTLEHYEHIIGQGIKTFVEVGQALLAIRDQRLYRQSYETFEEYLRQRWEMSRPRAYQLIDAAQVIDAVSTIVDIVPANESQARPLASLPAEQQREVWREVVETAPPSGITAKHVKETVKRVKAPSTGTKTQTVKPFDVQGITSKIKDLYMDWLKHCETDDALETAQFFLNTLSDLAQGRAMLLHRQ